MRHDQDVESIKKLYAAAEAAIKAGDWESFMALQDDDAVLLWPNEDPLLGKEVIYSWYREHIFDRFDYLKVAYLPQEVEVAGQWAFAWATSKGLVRSKSDGETAKFASKLLEILRRQPDGSWKYWRMALNMSPITPAEQ